ncbi:sulfite exporter TauE/SafE family protein [Robinsoniella peoriensis]|uniref:sulfite exporter TauE/SafE family protein n=1 Tax=Robinsoniella peoriensis TaxID=180332 RepID=UPI0006947FFD|nr:sulfite exporter TauE/SafE family protein [Robinsoniella peoriensis]
MLLTIGTLIYTLLKDRITTRRTEHRMIIFIIGGCLGMMSAFLGIGGGPVNLVVLYYLFSMKTKEAAAYSIYVIMFSQISNILSTIVQNRVPDFSPVMLCLMIGCGILGGLAGSSFNKKLKDKTVEQLFVWLMTVIICINIFNIIYYM